MQRFHNDFGSPRCELMRGLPRIQNHKSRGNQSEELVSGWVLVHAIENRNLTK